MANTAVTPALLGGPAEPRIRIGSPLAYALAVVVVATALALRAVLGHWITGVPYMAFMASAIVATFVGGLGPGLAASLLGGVCGWLFFIPPVLDIAAHDFSGVMAFVLYLLIAVAFCLIIHPFQIALRKLRAANRELARRIDENARLARERDRVGAELRQAQKMEAIGNLTGGMAHDFNNLLGVIVGNLDMLRAMARPTGEAEAVLGEALDAALRGAELTSRLLAFARRQPLKSEPIALNDLVADIGRLLRRVLGETIELDVETSADVWTVVGDRAQLETSLTNLASNARDAMQGGGRFTIATGNVTLDAAYAAEHSEVTPGDYALIEVSDTGTGIARDVLGRVFDPFFTTKEPGHGTGLGLSMVFGFVKQSGGHISVYSEEGVGTTFRLYLPRADVVVPEAAAPAPAKLDRGQGETVFVVEDNAGMRRIAVRQLRALGYRVIEAENGIAALELLEREPVDLLFTDVIMPGGTTGLDLARIAASRWPRLRVVLTSGFSQNNLELGAIGAARLLGKPYRQEELARTLRAALDQGETPPVSRRTAGVPA